MPKMPEKFEDWTPPWKTDDAIDPAKAGKLVFDLLKDQETNRAKIAEDKKLLTSLTAERDGFKDKAETTAGSDTAKDAEILQLKKDLRERTAEVERTKDYDSVVGQRDRFDVALDAGLSKVLAKRLVGKDRDELVADADELKSNLGIGSDDDGDQGGSSSRGSSFNAGDLTFSSRSAYRTGGEGAHGARQVEVDPAKVTLPHL